MKTRAYGLLCDDIRRGASGKLILVGVYTAACLFQFFHSIASCRNGCRFWDLLQATMNIRLKSRLRVRRLAEKQRPRGLVTIRYELTPLTRKVLHNGVYDAVIGKEGSRPILSERRILKATADRVPFNEMRGHFRVDVHLTDNAGLDEPSLPPGFTEEME